MTLLVVICVPLAIVCVDLYYHLVLIIMCVAAVSDSCFSIANFLHLNVQDHLHAHSFIQNYCSCLLCTGWVLYVLSSHMMMPS